MTASRLDELTVSPDDPHPWYGPCDALGIDGACTECSGTTTICGEAVCFECYPGLLEKQRPCRLARGTTPEPPAICEHGRYVGDICPHCLGINVGTTPEPVESEYDDSEQIHELLHRDCSVALHESLTALLELVAMIEQQGGHSWTWQQQAVWRAKQLLERHGRR